MPRSRPPLAPWIAGIGILAALGWALNRGQLEPADFTFANGAEVKSLDPAIVTGQPENRMINALFEGLVQWHPETLEPIPGVAERWEISDDKLRYTFHLRDNARWSDGSPVAAEDFYYSMRRFLDPRTGAEYAYQAWYINNAKRYSSGGRAVRPGDRVEIELNLPAEAVNSRRGEVLRGELERIEDARGTALNDEQLAAAAANADFALEDWTFVVNVDGSEARFRYADDVAAASQTPPAGVRWCRQVLIDFRDVGVELIDAHTIRFTLENPTAYFLNLLGFYPLFPVQRACVENYGSPEWTAIDKIVCNGPFTPEFRHLRDRTRVRRNPQYWNREAIKLETVDFLAVESTFTALNLYLTGKADWINDIPPPALRELLKREPPPEDINSQPYLNTYFYLLNTTHKPLDDVRVRRALSLAMDRTELTTRLLAGGERPAYSLVPPVLPNYEPPECAKENVAEARRLLAEAGYPGGRGFPVFEISYNTHETHQSIAQLIRKQWQRNLGIRVRTRNEEFATLLSNQRSLNFDISRIAWIGDYPDPNTYLDMFITGGDNNRTGWSSPEYDRLIQGAAKEPDAEKRLTMLHDAERILMDELPALPFYFYVSKNMVKPYVRGFYNNFQDCHPISAIWIDREQKTPNPYLKGRR
jgi:oligopeptide transport system substrate-binding protein